MQITVFFQELFERKKVFIGSFILGVIIFALVGYMGRMDVNNGILYCSESNIFLEGHVNVDDMNSENTYQNKNVAIVSSDNVIRNTVNDLAKQEVSISISQLKDSLIVYSMDDVVSITVKGSDPTVIEQICKVYTTYAVEELKLYNSEDNVVVLNEASEPFSAVISVVDDPNNPRKPISVVIPKAVTQITMGYTIMEMIKYGVLGGILFLLIAAFIIAVKVLVKGRN